MCVLFAGKKAQDTYSKLYERYSNYKTRENNQMKDEENTIKNQNDPYDELKKIKELLDMGIITQEEFDTKKKELLNL